jgi:hypothetical protein
MLIIGYYYIAIIGVLIKIIGMLIIKHEGKKEKVFAKSP